MDSPSKTFKRDAPEDIETLTLTNTGVVSSPKRQRHSGEDAAWNQKFYELMVYKAKYGNVNVRAADEDNKGLYKWIMQQRKEYKLLKSPEGSSVLNAERVSVLESINFSFGTRGDENWFHHYENLKKFKEKHGHLLVPRKADIPGLGDWVVTQRMQHAQLLDGQPSQLTPLRRELLDEIGFVWQIRVRPAWQSRFDELVEYKKKNGHSKVPQHYVENRALGKWVAKQRQQYKLLKAGKKSFLTPDRLERLEEIGFVWSVKGNDVEDHDV